ncbi:hypothetical protein BGX23_003305 [Mortierella sp. AD031]|nr:hypothetical protein BGX23_003305 [Mortierella sp. AD031]
MALNARTLTRVSLRNVRIPYPIEIRCLCRAISSLERLTHLNINIPATNISTKPAFSIVLLIFFSCPTSLVFFKLTAITRPNREGEDDEYFQEPRTNDPDLTEGPIARRAEPLRNLKSLTLPIYEGGGSVSGYGARDLQDILSHCPALEDWDVPCLRDADTRGVITAFLRQRPILNQPSLPATLRTLTSESPGKDRKGLTMAEIMDLIPKDQLKSLSFQHYEDIPTNTAWPGSGQFLSVLLRHSRSLVSISLLNMDQIQSNTTKAIVTNCEALEALVLSCSNAMRSRLTLEDATDQPWSCLRLKQLSLAVDLRRGYENQGHMLHLFYHQLGKLTSLEELELISACRKSSKATAQYWETTMTSMLSLGNAHVTPSKRGVLSFLVCLSRLRVLLGSFNIVQKEMREMFGEAEAAWVLQHWPRLEFIELFTSTERLTRRLEFPQVGLLLEHRPNLRLYREK